MPITSAGPALGTQCPAFSLPSVNGERFELASFARSKALLVTFMCNHCPYVVAVQDRLLALAHSYESSRLQVVGICSNDATSYPADAPEELLKRWQEKQYGFPYLVDETQSVARAFAAVCTPEFFLYGPDRKLFYHGRFDDNWKEPWNVMQHELKAAVDGLLAGNPPPRVQHPCMGCSIKWKSEN